MKLYLLIPIQALSRSVKTSKWQIEQDVCLNFQRYLPNGTSSNQRRRRGLLPGRAQAGFLLSFSSSISKLDDCPSFRRRCLLWNVGKFPLGHEMSRDMMCGFKRAVSTLRSLIAVKRRQHTLVSRSLELVAISPLAPGKNFPFPSSLLSLQLQLAPEHFFCFMREVYYILLQT